MEFYENELNLLAEDLSEKFANLSESLLKTEEFSENLKKENEELKVFLQDFLKDYPHIKRYTNFQPVMILLTNLANTNYTNEFEKDAEKEQKFKQLFNNYFKDIIKDYSKKYEIFIEKKVLPKIEDSYKELKPENKRFLRDFLKLIDNFKSCKELQCFPIFMGQVMSGLNMTKDLIMKYTLKDYKHELNIVYIGTFNRSKLLLKDDLLEQLSAEVKQNLTQDLNNLIKIFENNTDTEEFVLKVNKNLNLVKKYYRNTNFSTEDQEILNQIFSKYTSNWEDNSKYRLTMLDVTQSLSVNMIFFIVLAPDAIPKEYNHLFEFVAF